MLQPPGEVFIPLQFETASWALALTRSYSLGGVMRGATTFPQVLLTTSGCSRGSVETPPGGVQQPPTTHRDTRPWEITLVHHSAGSAVFPAVNKCLNKSFYLGFPSLPPKMFCSDGNPVHCDFTDGSEMPVSSPSKASAGLETKPMSLVPRWCHLVLLLHSLAAAWRFTPSDFQHLVQRIPQNK